MGSATSIPGSEAVGVAAPAEAAKRRTPPAPLSSIGDLLRAAYAVKRKRLAPRKAEISAMHSATTLPPAERDELLALAAADRTLERTRELLLLSAERFGTSALGAQVRAFAGDVLQRHPAFRSPSLDGVLANLPEAVGEEAAVEFLATQNYGSLPWPEGAPTLTRAAAQACRTNAVYCLLLWFRETRGMPFPRIQRHLHATLWAPAGRRLSGDVQRLRLLMGARDLAAIAVASSALEKHALEQGQLAAAAQRAEERAVARAAELDEALARAESRLEEATAQIAALTDEGRRLRETHADEIAHRRDAFEDLRGRILRCLRRESALLASGLQALRGPHPKPEVMDDHADRVIEALKREIERVERLRGDD